MPYCFHVMTELCHEAQGQPQTIMQMVGHGHGVLPYKWWGARSGPGRSLPTLALQCFSNISMIQIHLVGMQILIQNLWARASNEAFLTMVVLAGHGPAGTHAYSTGSREERIMCCVPYALTLILFFFYRGKNKEPSSTVS